MKDGGYDTSDYRQVDPIFGVNNDIVKLIREAEKRGIRVITDLAMNHSSDQHPWFQEERKHPHGDNRDMYVWRKPPSDGSAPTNWPSFFEGKAGSAWTKDKESDMFYFHKFHSTQPDLNLYNPKVLKEMEEVIKFWLDLGMGGIRFDVISHILHDPTFTDAQPNPEWKTGDPLVDQLRWQKHYLLPDVYPITRNISSLLKKYSALGIGEIYSDDGDMVYERIRRFITEGEMAMPFNFTLLLATQKSGADAKEFKKALDQYAACLPNGAVSTNVLGNHDQSLRLADRVGEKNIRAVTLLQLTSAQTPFIYMGDELGMVKGEAITLDNQQDPQGKELGITYSRDHSRTGFLWENGKPNGGYSSHPRPWLPVGTTLDGRGAKEQASDPESILRFTKRVIQDRKNHPALCDGQYNPLESPNPDVLTFKLRKGRENVITGFNFSSGTRELPLPKDAVLKVIRSTHNNRNPGEIVKGGTRLAPNEGVIFECLDT